MTATEEFGFQADPAPMAFDLMQRILSDDDEASVSVRIEFIKSLLGEASTMELGTWMRSALPD